MRVIAATNRNLPQMVRAGSFREDLYYRLNVFPMALPPLRERADDIPLLVQHFLRRFARQAGKRDRRTSRPRRCGALLAYHWPGNVRELQNVIERAVILSRGATSSTSTPCPICPRSPSAGRRDRRRDGSRRRQRREPSREVERCYVEQVLAETRWVIEGERGAARRLGLHPNTLRSRLKRWGVNAPPER